MNDINTFAQEIIDEIGKKVAVDFNKNAKILSKEVFCKATGTINLIHKKHEKFLGNKGNEYNENYTNEQINQKFKEIIKDYNKLDIEELLRQDQEKVFFEKIYITKDKCLRCRGSGRLSCSSCGGSGTVSKTDRRYKKGYRTEKCSLCSGSGRGQSCIECRGDGYFNNYYKNSHVAKFNLCVSNIGSAPFSLVSQNLEFFEYKNYSTDDKISIAINSLDCFRMSFEYLGRKYFVNVIANSDFSYYTILNLNELAQELQHYTLQSQISKYKIPRILFVIIATIFFAYLLITNNKGEYFKEVANEVASKDPNAYYLVAKTAPSQRVNIISTDVLKNKCDNGDSLACQRLSHAYAGGGLWTYQDFDKAAFYKDQARIVLINGCKQNIAKDCYELANSYSLGKLGLKKNQKTADTYYAKACKLGFKVACYQ